MRRSMERTRFNLRTSAKLIEDALERGKRAEDFTGRERKFLSGKTDEGISAIVYNGYCFIVNDWEGICITMYQLPGWFGKKQTYCGKEKIRNPYKYRRFNADMSEDWQAA